ncbi:MAG: hypothetical protein AABX04_01400 [Nanoarchaeota archaeon]
MENYLLLNHILELEELSKSLGFSKTLFLGQDIMIVKGNPREILNGCKEAQRQKQVTIYFAENEERLRFVLEKTSVNLVLGMEKIFHKDSPHYPKSGMDQILAKLAVATGKTMGFSFSELLNVKDKGKLMHRISFNLGLCKKYKVNFIFGNFSLRPEEMRSAADLEAIRRVLDLF